MEFEQGEISKIKLRALISNIKINFSLDLNLDIPMNMDVLR